MEKSRKRLGVICATILLAATACKTDENLDIPEAAEGAGLNGLPSNAMTITCNRTSTSLDVSIVGPIQSGVFMSLTGSAVYLEYGSQTDGWDPYGSGSNKARVLWSGDWINASTVRTYTLSLPLNVGDFNPFLYEPSSGTRTYFDLNQWTIGGSCWRNGGGISQGTSTGGTPASGYVGIISCSRTSGALSVTVSGNVAQGLKDGAAPSDGDVRLAYGSDTDGWLAPYTNNGNKPQVSWYSWVQNYTLALATNVNNFNFVLYGVASGTSRWFDLTRWQVVGDCWPGGGKIATNATASPAPTPTPTPTPQGLAITCTQSGPDMTYTITGSIQTGLVEAVPSCSTTLRLDYGSDTEGWAPSSGSTYGYFHPELTQHQLTLPGNDQSVNFFLYCPGTGGISWFKLDAWSVGGLCHRYAGDNIRH